MPYECHKWHLIGMDVCRFPTLSSCSSDGEVRRDVARLQRTDREQRLRSERLSSELEEVG